MHRIHPHLPIPHCITVDKSNIHGLGLIAVEDIEPGTDLGITHILNPDYEDGLIRTPLGGFLNHSDSPNCQYKENGNNLRLITIKKINKGEEITVSYRGWYDDKVLDTYK
ncbi:MAG: SET domain-containing protein-lysine N-methyltransferase [Candidatus Saccharimonadales bacterium]